jgi:hypothetical protein
VKSYHEIRHEEDDRSYIPNFDIYTLDQMIDTIFKYKGINKEKIRTTWTEEEIKKVFHDIAGKESSVLETDVLEFS